MDTQPATGDRSLLAFFRDVYYPVRLLGKSPRTLTLYDYSIRKFGEYLGRPATLDDLTDQAVAVYLAHLLANGASKHLAKKERAQLLAMWRFAARKRLVHEFPEVMQIHAPAPVPVAWTVEQLKDLLTACRMYGQFCPTPYNGTPPGDWWYALHLLLWDTGERISAVLQLEWDDISGHSVCFRAETRKGGRSNFQAVIRPETLQAVQQIRKTQRTGEKLVFPWPFSQTYIYRAYARILRAAGLPSGRKRKFHAIRRSVATHVKAAGGDACAALGHSDPRLTERSYIDRFICRPVAASDVLPPIT